MRILGLLLCLFLLLLINSIGCGPTYPKEKLTESVIEICKKEYNIDVKSKVMGKTLAVFIPLPSLFDITLRINEEAQDMIQDVILSTTRIVLSTDAKIEFYCIIAQDIRLPEVQLVIIKYVDDVKRAFFQDISRDEYFKRTIFDMSLNPQSEKEKNIKDIFRKHNLGLELEEKVLDEFFRGTPLELEDFGYWQDRFYIKDITLPEFLAAQMAYRIKMRFREDKELSKKFLIRSANGGYKEISGRHFFLIYFDIKMPEILKVLGRSLEKEELFKNAFLEIADCLYGYKFKDFSQVRIFDRGNLLKLFVSKEDIYAFKKGKLGIENILAGI